MGFSNKNVFSSALLVLSVLCAALVTTTASTSTEDKSKQVDKQTTEIVNDNRTREIYIKCLLDKGPCNNDAADVKSW